MLPALSLAPLTLAAVLLLSGLAKLRDPQATAGMITALRLPSPLRHRVAPRALPVVELVTAALLLAPWAWAYAVGAALSLALFAAFLAVVARAMTFHPRPTCGCFGRVGDHRVSGRTVARNVLLLALALVAAWLAVHKVPAGALVGGYGSGDRAWLLMAVALAAVAVLVLGAGTQVVPTDRPRTEQDTAGAVPSARSDAMAGAERRDRPDDERLPIPRGVLLSQDLDVVPLRRLPRQQAQLLVLVSCWCGPTFESIERLPRWRETLPQLGVQLVHTHRPWAEDRLDGLEGVWWDPGSSVYDALRAGASPAAVLLGTDGLLAGGPVNGVEDIEDLVDRLAGAPASEGPASREQGSEEPASDDQPVG